MSGERGGYLASHEIPDFVTKELEARATLLARAKGGDVDALIFLYRHYNKFRLPLVEKDLKVSLPWHGHDQS